MRFSLLEQDGRKSITVFYDGELLTATDTHPNFEKIVAAVRSDRDVPNFAELFDTERAVARRFQRLSERVTVRNAAVYFDGEEVHSTLTDHILRALDEGEDFKALVLFMEKLAQNPNKNSREMLYNWLQASRGFTITDDGDILGYKGVAKDQGGNYVSVSQGTATVDGVEHTGAIPNYVGAVVEMPRSAVTFDPDNTCSVGLHVGVWDYAKSFGRAGTLKVKVNPRDVVSVPSDVNGQKMRVCRYTVLEATEKKYEGTVYHMADPDPEDFEDEDYGYDNADWDEGFVY